MSKLKEAIEELLEKIRHYLVIGRDEGTGELIAEIDDILSLLRQLDVEPNEFTKEARKDYEGLAVMVGSAVDKLLKACDLLDLQTAENEKLKQKIERLLISVQHEINKNNCNLAYQWISKFLLELGGKNEIHNRRS